jgi:hypothetical protein
MIVLVIVLVIAIEFGQERIDDEDEDEDEDEGSSVHALPGEPYFRGDAGAGIRHVFDRGAPVRSQPPDLKIPVLGGPARRGTEGEYNHGPNLQPEIQL